MSRREEYVGVRVIDHMTSEGPCYDQWLTDEPIVRCRDCKHMHTVRHWLGMDVDECWLHADRESGALGKERTEPDGFCAWGERRDDGQA